ncbi:PAC1 [Symbiodinium natans]|uniref:PAC1 protein n=1 Tax=Symbiodinium natans TaxID=878477 RepID=A0A812QG60_9DINO|nr:PAC1 [Symbiodinium natans]
MAFLREGLSKFMHAVKNDAEQALPPYSGHLTADRFQLHTGVLLGAGGIVPRTLTYVPKAALIGFCTTAGHVRLISAEHEETLQNPVAPLQPEFLSFPRAGLVLLVGVATMPTESSSSASSNAASWIAQWWEFKGSAGHQLPQHARLRFGVTCMTTSVDASLVFFGTDEGDIRVFDAGERPHLAPYCISWAALHNHKKALSTACPITALAAVPHSVPELLVSTGDGSLVLWSFDKHRVSRAYDSNSSIVSLVWCQSGSHFLAASRSDVSVYCRSSSSVLVRVVLPGGPSQHVELLKWTVGDISTTPSDKLSASLGQVLLLRSRPSSALLLMSGEAWSKVDTILPDVAQAVLCDPECPNAQPCGCPNLLFAAFAEDAFSKDAEAVRRDAFQQCILAIHSSRTHVSVASAFGDGTSQVWPVSWGSLQLSDVRCLQILPKSVLNLQQSVKATEASPDVPELKESAAEAPIRWAVRDGRPQDGVDVSTAWENASSDGWFVLVGCGEPTEEPVDEKLHWKIPLNAQLLECQASFSLDAQVDLCIWDGADTERILHFDIQEQTASWGAERQEVDLAPGAEHCIQLEMDTEQPLPNVTIDGCALPWVVQRPQAIGWQCRRGELRLRYMFTRAQMSKTSSSSEAPEVFKEELNRRLPPVQLAEAMFAHHVAHYQSFMRGACTPPKCQAFVEDWQLLAGGCQGLLCSGHKDGCVRVWLRGHGSVLLLHVLSVQPLDSLPWRPRFDPNNGCVLESTLSGIYDGVDCCPAFPAGENAEAAVAVTAVALELAAGAVAAGCSSGEVVLFMWQREAQVPSPVELAEWKVQSLLLAAQEGQASQSREGEHTEPPELPPGFACSMRLRQHQACVTQLQVVYGEGTFQILSVDANSRFCVVDCSSGQLLFSQEVSGLSSPSTGPQPPRETLEAVVLSHCILQVARSSPTASAAETNRLKMELLAKEATPHVDTYLLAFSSGELRQVAGHPKDLKLLDNRIRETRLPQLAGGSFQALFLHNDFLLAVQSAGLSIFKRDGDKLLPGGSKTTFSGRAMGAGVVEIDGELCLYVILRNGQLDIVALPSLHPIVSLQAGSCARRFLQGHEHGENGDQLGVFPGGTVCSDGYFALQCGGVLWIGGASDVRECHGLEASSQAVRSAFLLQTLQGVDATTRTDAPERSSKPSGILGTLFGRGAQKSLRECALPADPLPAEVDGRRLDQGRGLVSAWQSQTSQGVPGPFGPAGPSGRQSARSETAPQQRAAAGVREALAGATANAIERGDKMSSLADSSRRLADNADQFLDLAKQLNAQQNRWF